MTWRSPWPAGACCPVPALPSSPPTLCAPCGGGGRVSYAASPQRGLSGTRNRPAARGCAPAGGPVFGPIPAGGRHVADRSDAQPKRGRPVCRDGPYSAVPTCTSNAASGDIDLGHLGLSCVRGQAAVDPVDAKRRSGGRPPAVQTCRSAPHRYPPSRDARRGRTDMLQRGGNPPRQSLRRPAVKSSTSPSLLSRPGPIAGRQKKSTGTRAARATKFTPAFFSRRGGA